MILVYGNNPLSIRRGQLVGIDTETTGVNWEHTLIGVSLAWRSSDETMKSCYMVPEDKTRLFQDPGVTIPNQILSVLFKNNQMVYHSLPFDFRVLYKHYSKEFDLGVPEIAHDVVHMAKLTDYQDSYSLMALYQKYVETAPAEWASVKAKRSQLVKMNQEIVYKYGAFDAIATLRVYEKLRSIMNLSEELYGKDLLFTNLVMKMIQRGLPVDLDFVANKKKKCNEEMIDISKKLTVLGISNPDSTKQVSKYLTNHGYIGEKTKNGQLKTDVESLMVYADDAVVSQIVEYRQLSKAVSSWLDPVRDMTLFDGRLHSMFYPFGTASYRMTSSDINVQAIPMEIRSTAFGERAFGSFKGMFKSEIPGEKLYAIDAKQAEFRLGAMLAKENNIAKAFSSGIDPYVQMAIDTYGDMARRQDAKRAALASLYETGVNTFAKTNHVTHKEAEDVLFGFRNKYPRIKEASRFYEEIVVHKGYVTLMDGRRRYFGPYDETYKAFNQRVQGSVAVVMWPVMLEIERNFPGRIVNQVHDSIVMYLPENEEHRNEFLTPIYQWVSEAVPERVRNMTDPQIPFIADCKLWE